MKRTIDSSAKNDLILLWLACFAALCGGYYLAFGLIGAAIDRQHARAEEVAALARADAQTIAARSDLERAERMLSARLERLDLHADKPTTVARFIHTAAAVAAANRVSVVTIDERPGPDLGASNVPHAPTAGFFEPIPLDVTLSGSYRDLLATIRALAAAPVAVQIEIAAIERASSTAAGRPLSAHLHIVLDRLADDLAQPHAPLSPSEEPSTHARPF